MLSASSSLLSTCIHCEVATPENNTAGVHVCGGMEGGGATGMGGGGWSHTQSFLLTLFRNMKTNSKPVMCVGVLFVYYMCSSLIRKHFSCNSC